MVVSGHILESEWLSHIEQNQAEYPPSSVSEYIRIMPVQPVQKSTSSPPEQ